MNISPSTNGDAASIGTYNLTQDTRAIAEILCSACTELSPAQRRDVYGVADELWECIVKSLRKIFPGVMTFSEDIIQQSLITALRRELNGSGSVALCLDKYLLRTTDDVPDPLLRGLQISRMADGKKYPRQGALPIDQQLDLLVQEVNGRPIIVVDDGIFSGGSMRYVLEQLLTRRMNIASILVFMGNPDVRQVAGVHVHSVHTLDNCIDWVDARDVTILGGRPEKLSAKLRVASSRPYIAPFSDGRAASLDPRILRQTSREILEAQESFFVQLGNIIGRTMTLRDALRAGFPLPQCDDPEGRPLGLSSTLQDVTIRARKILDAQDTATGDILLDMDGTLYTLDGPGNGFAGSTLEKEVHRNALVFVQDREPCAEDEAQNIVATGLKDAIGLSAYLSRRYGMTRREYFEQVWGKIDPGLIVGNSNAGNVLRALKKKGKVLRLLTSAPSIWAEKVIDYLCVRDCLESITTSEEYRSKTEIFERYRGNPNVKSMLSVGDQRHSDILPAVDVGMQAIQVSVGRSISYLLSLP